MSDYWTLEKENYRALAPLLVGLHSMTPAAVDVERTHKRLKDLLVQKRMRLRDENVQRQLAIAYNSKALDSIPQARLPAFFGVLSSPDAWESFAKETAVTEEEEAEEDEIMTAISADDDGDFSEDGDDSDSSLDE